MKQHGLVSQPLCQARAEIQMNTCSVSAGVVMTFLVKKRVEYNSAPISYSLAGCLYQALQIRLVARRKKNILKRQLFDLRLLERFKRHYFSHNSLLTPLAWYRVRP